MSENITLWFFFLLSVLFGKSHGLKPNHEEPIGRGMFVFGSSVVDNGNNNFLLNSLAKVDYFPYGVDFPLGPSGRFTNGKNVVDIIGEKLNLPNYIPPFNDPSTRGPKIVHGVNYASGGSGILDDTGTLAGNVTSFNQQINNFEKVTLPEMAVQLGQNSTNVLPEFLFVVGSGGNDYSLNYFLNLATRNVSIEAFTANLTSTLSNHLKRLHALGARKFVLMAINPNGCSPMAMTMMAPSQNDCVRSLNTAVHMFNSELRSLADRVRPQMPGSNLVFVNSYKIIVDIIRSPSSKGFRNVSGSCCETSTNGILCNRGGQICKNRREYVYFDGLHPTEAVNDMIATKAFASELRAEVYPFNVKKLSKL